MKAFVTLPTFNESKNIETLIREIRRQDPAIGIVVADDDSPDGTWRIVEEISKKDPNVHLLRRTTNKGRGSAGVDAFRFALQQQADVVIEMDADFSHDPKHIPQFLEKIREYDLVIGSRAVSQGQDRRKSQLRKWITHFSTLYTRSILGLPVKDCNSGYRCFRRKVLEAVDLDTIRSTGPCHCPGTALQSLSPRVFHLRDSHRFHRERSRGVEAQYGKTPPGISHDPEAKGSPPARKVKHPAFVNGRSIMVSGRI